MVPGVDLDDVCPGVAPKLPESAWAAGRLVNDEDLRHGETLRAFCHGRMPELLQPGYRFRPTGRQLLLLRDGRAGLLSIFAHDSVGLGHHRSDHRVRLCSFVDSQIGLRDGRGKGDLDRRLLLLPTCRTDCVVYRR